MTGTVADKRKLKKTGFYKKRILEIQENFKLFTAIAGAVTLIMLILNIANACTGKVGLGWAIFLNCVWIALIIGFVGYVWLGCKRKREAFRRIDEITYEGMPSDYVLCEPDESAFGLKGTIRLYETEKYYCLIADGVRENLNGFWTKYDFKRDFGTLYFDKSVFRCTQQEELYILESENDKINLRRKRV